MIQAALRVSVSENTSPDLDHKGFLLCSLLLVVRSWFFHLEFSPTELALGEEVSWFDVALGCTARASFPRSALRG